MQTASTISRQTTEIANGDYLSVEQRSRTTISKVEAEITQLLRPGTSPDACQTGLLAGGQYSSAEQNRSPQLIAEWVTPYPWPTVPAPLHEPLTSELVALNVLGIGP
jgi:hypothetical protein